MSTRSTSLVFRKRLSETYLSFAPAARAELESLARDGYPFEACGLLLGETVGRLVRVVDVTSARNLNVERAHDRYELDPRDLLAGEERAEGLGLTVLGIWHTHPDHPARPSETDRAAAWPGWSYVIVSVRDGAVADLRSWRLHDRVFLEERIP